MDEIIKQEDMDILKDLAEKNSTSIAQIIRMMMDECLHDIIISHKWHCSYNTSLGHPWKTKKI